MAGWTDSQTSDFADQLEQCPQREVVIVVAVVHQLSDRCEFADAFQRMIPFEGLGQPIPENLGRS